jgi:hypothetical protein
VKAIKMSAKLTVGKSPGETEARIEAEPAETM